MTNQVEENKEKSIGEILESALKKLEEILKEQKMVRYTNLRSVTGPAVTVDIRDGGGSALSLDSQGEIRKPTPEHELIEIITHHSKKKDATGTMFIFGIPA